MRDMRGFAHPGLIVLLIVLGSACTPTVESQSSSAANPSGWSSNEADAQTSAKVAPDKPKRWEHMDGLSSFRKAGARARSQHLQGEHEAEVLVNEAAGAYPALGPTRTLGPGSVLVEALYATNQPEVAMYFVMSKSAGSNSEWEYAVVSSNGMVERRGALALCARCHAEAPYGQVFGRPR
jgi:hypothetical protein